MHVRPIYNTKPGINQPSVHLSELYLPCTVFKNVSVYTKAVPRGNHWYLCQLPNSLTRTSTEMMSVSKGFLKLSWPAGNMVKRNTMEKHALTCTCHRLSAYIHGKKLPWRSCTHSLESTFLVHNQIISNNCFLPKA